MDVVLRGGEWNDRRAQGFVFGFEHLGVGGRQRQWDTRGNGSSALDVIDLNDTRLLVSEGGHLS